MRRFSFGKEVRPASNSTVGIDGNEPGQAPRDTCLLDLTPRCRRIPRQLANPILLLACVEHLCVGRVGITPVADVHWSRSRAVVSRLWAHPTSDSVYSLPRVPSELRVEPGAESQESSASDRLLSRELGVRQLAAVIFNYTVGSGIFVLPAVVAAQLGPSAILAYLVCAFIMALSVVCFAEAGSRVSASGGPYAYVETAFGPLAGFLTGVLNLLSALAAAAAVASAFSASAAALIGTASSLVQALLMAAVLIAAGAINIRSVGGGARLVEIAVAAKLVPLVLFVVIGAAFVRPESLSWSSSPSLLSVMSASGVLIFAFLGIEGALQPSGEVRDPSRTVPRAVFLAIAGVVALYVEIG